AAVGRVGDPRPPPPARVGCGHDGRGPRARGRAGGVRGGAGGRPRGRGGARGPPAARRGARARAATALPGRGRAPRGRPVGGRGPADRARRAARHRRRGARADRPGGRAEPTRRRRARLRHDPAPRAARARSPGPAGRRGALGGGGAPALAGAPARRPRAERSRRAGPRPQPRRSPAGGGARPGPRASVGTLSRMAQVGGALEKALRFGEGRRMKRLQEQAAYITSLEPELRALSDAELRAKTAEFRQRLGNGEPLDDLLFEAYAAVREARLRESDQRMFDVQLMGGIVLHEGDVAEMKTGEGKTFVASLALYLNALPTVTT